MNIFFSMMQNQPLNPLFPRPCNMSVIAWYSLRLFHPSVMIPLKKNLAAPGIQSLTWTSEAEGGVFMICPGRHQCYIWIGPGWAGRPSLNIASNARLSLKTQRIRVSQVEARLDERRLLLLLPMSHYLSIVFVSISILFHFNMISCFCIGQQIAKKKKKKTVNKKKFM